MTNTEAINWIINISADIGKVEHRALWHYEQALDEIREMLESVQPDIIRCNACKHWTQTTGNMPGFGLGDCDYFNAKLVSCNGFCYWAERRADG